MRTLRATCCLATLLVAASCSGRTERDPTVTALQVELLERGRRDQAIRDTVFGAGLAMDQGALRRMLAVDSDNSSWLKEQIRLHGFPTEAKVGKGAANAAFLIIQHATHDPAFQRAMLDTVTAAFGRGEADGQSYALLFDRVTVQSGGRQRYGTQAKIESNRVVFDPMEDSAHVDSLRSTVGLPPLAEYRRTLDSVYFRKDKPDGGQD